jgi:hypothetical protein
MQGDGDNVWRGTVNQLTYGIAGLGRRDPVDDARVARTVDDMLHQRTFAGQPEDYYSATVDALASGRQLAYDSEDEELVRDFLTRLLAELDARRPWPVLPFTRVTPQQWPALSQARPIGRIPLSHHDVRGRLRHLFDKVTLEGQSVDVLTLRLRTGEMVALRAGPSYTEPGVTLLAQTTDPAATIAAFREATGLDVGRLIADPTV